MTARLQQQQQPDAIDATALPQKQQQQQQYAEAVLCLLKSRGAVVCPPNHQMMPTLPTISFLG